MLVNHKLGNIHCWYTTIYNLEFWLCTKAMGFYEIIFFLQIYKYKYSKFKLNRTFDWILIIKVVNSSSNISFQIFWCFTHSILSYREFVCSSPGATPFHYAAIDSLSQYTQTKFFYQSRRKIWKSGGRGHIVMGWGLPPWFYRVKARNMCKIISLVPSKNLSLEKTETN